MTEKALKPIKPFLNYEEQINNLIEQKGMIVNDHKFAVSKLEDISYFALIDGYKNLFYNPMTRKYKEGTTFEDLVALYEFDEKLRTLIFRYLCHFEQKMKLPRNGNKYKCGKNDLFSVVIAFRMLLAKEDFAEFKKSLNQIINQYMKKTGNLNQDLFFKAMGFPENWKNISRYKL